MVDDSYFSLDRKSGVPLYLQIRDAIKSSVLTGDDRSETILPPQRELAAKLRVSRNTVSMAYAELEREGLVASQVGKGTVVLGAAGKMESRNRREKLLRTIEHSVEEALVAGLTLDEYFDTVRDFLRERKEALRHTRIVFVECNREQLLYFADHLNLGPSVVISPVLLDDIRDSGAAKLREIRSADMVVTSFYHIEELEKLVGRGGPSLVGINLQPEMSTIVNIARIPRSSVVGLVAASKQFLSEISKTLREVGIDERRVKEYASPHTSLLDEFVESVDAIIVSPSRKAEVKASVEDQRVVEFLFAPDDASVNNIRVALLEVNRRRKGEVGDARTDN